MNVTHDVKYILLKILLWYWVFVLGTFSSQAQQHPISFEEISLEHGLSQASVRVVFQDHKGMLWFGTEDGLNKYDGYTFTSYHHIPGDSTSLSTGQIISIVEDRYGALWIAMENQGVLNRFDRKTEQFTFYLIDSNDFRGFSYSGNNVVNMLRDKAGDLWVGTTEGLSRMVWDMEAWTPHFIHYKHDPENPHSLQKGALRDFHESIFGGLWVSTENGLDYFDRDLGKFIHYQHEPGNVNSLSHNNVLAMVEDDNGILWMTSKGGLDRFDKRTNQWKHYGYLGMQVPTDYVQGKLTKVVDGTFWLAIHQKSLYHFDTRTGDYITYDQDPKNPYHIDFTIHSIFVDVSGTLWIGTHNSGVKKYDPSFKKFVTYPKDLGKHSPYQKLTVRTLYEGDDGTLWLSCENKRGLLAFDQKSKRFAHYINGFPSKALSFSSIAEDPLGNLWLGGQGSVYTVDKVSKTFRKVRRFSGSTIFPLQITSGKLWVLGEKNNLYHFDIEGDSLIDYYDDLPIVGGVRVLYMDSSQALWLGGNKGIVRLDPDIQGNYPNLYSSYRHDPNNPNSLSHNRINCMYRDAEGVLWVGTYGGGLNKVVFDAQQNPVFTHYRVEDGLANNVVYGILGDNQGYLWMSTNKGLSKFDPRTETFRNYDVQDGLQSNEYNYKGFFKSKTGKLFFSGINGWNAFDPEEIKDNPYIPPTVFTDFELFNKKVGIGGDSPLQQAIDETEELVLSYDQSVFSIEFAALNYTQSEKNQYAYLLEGFDEEWNDIGHRRRVTFTNLDPKTYTLRVKASNNDGLWNEEGRSIRIIITPPWWRTWWAYMLWALLIVSSIAALFRFRLNRLRLQDQLRIEHQEAERLQEINQIKSEFFSNITHEFRTPLSLILGPVETLLEKHKTPDSQKLLGFVRQNAHRLLKLINQLLDFSKLESNKMEVTLSHGDIVRFIRDLVAAFQPLAREKGISLHFFCKDERLMADFDADKLEKVLYNLLSNALKFTRKGGWVKVAVKGGYQEGVLETIEIEVQDNGIGIAFSQLESVFDRFYQVDASPTREAGGTGIGLALTKELVGLMGGKITVQSTEGVGSEFCIYLPIVSKQNTITHDDGPLPKISANEVTAQAVHSEKENMSTGPGKKEAPERPLLLIVEDSLELQSYLQQQLAPMYDIVQALDGEEGLQQAFKHTPDLIVTDVMMPKKDGYEMARLLKEDEKTSHIPIVMLTAKAAMPSRMAGLQTGVDAYIPKPFHIKELTLQIKNLIVQRQKLRARYQQVFSLESKDIQMDSLEKKFLERVKQLIESHLDDEHFSVTVLSEEMGMSRSQVTRKLKALTGQPPKELINSFRLERAREMLKRHTGTIAEIAYDVGFSKPAYFSECFKQKFGISPRDVKVSNE